MPAQVTHALAHQRHEKLAGGECREEEQGRRQAGWRATDPTRAGERCGGDEHQGHPGPDQPVARRGEGDKQLPGPICVAVYRDDVAPLLVEMEVVDGEMGGGRAQPQARQQSRVVEVGGEDIAGPQRDLAQAAFVPRLQPDRIQACQSVAPGVDADATLDAAVGSVGRPLRRAHRQVGTQLRGVVVVDLGVAAAGQWDQRQHLRERQTDDDDPARALARANRRPGQRDAQQRRQVEELRLGRSAHHGAQHQGYLPPAGVHPEQSKHQHGQEQHECELHVERIGERHVVCREQRQRKERTEGEAQREATPQRA
ncbi:hypothetical protein [Alkalisalibacterium limincola]|uniref:Uncharacterized protein n=1 Tax=Alkalisalibacterium limincola TaxID=2699169 RepID=A0A5C8KPS8_9GAMM|nr:hypothetical protein [Alkalisalibacterium limincola]TXK62219.1 hypothetical protein FU658_08165 [Alkalisalibacterium limincola]